MRAIRTPGSAAPPRREQLGPLRPRRLVLRETGFFTDPASTTHGLTGHSTIDTGTIDHTTTSQSTIDHGTVGQTTIDHDTIGSTTVHDQPAGADSGTHDQFPGSGADVAHTQHVPTTGDGKTPELLLKNLQPDTRYIVDNGTYIYETDTVGRVVYAEGHLDQIVDAADRVRNPSEQRLAGGADRLPGDHGGHFFATLFGGPGEGINLTGQHAHVNLSDYKRLEIIWADAIKDGKTVRVEVTATYPGDKLRPSQYDVTYQIGNGREVQRTIDNPEP